jgi:hypothetical protein
MLENEIRKKINLKTSCKVKKTIIKEIRFDRKKIKK